MARQLRGLEEAGMPCIMNFPGGLGGHGCGPDHARKTAGAISRLHPVGVCASEQTLFPGTLLFHALGKGLEEAAETERLGELISSVQVPTVFKAEHVAIRGRLPHRERMLSQVRGLVQDAKDGRFDQFRQSAVGLRWPAGAG